MSQMLWWMESWEMYVYLRDVRTLMILSNIIIWLPTTSSYSSCTLSLSCRYSKQVNLCGIMGGIWMGTASGWAVCTLTVYNMTRCEYVWEMWRMNETSAILMGLEYGWVLLHQERNAEHLQATICFTYGRRTPPYSSPMRIRDVSFMRHISQTYSQCVILYIVRVQRAHHDIAYPRAKANGQWSTSIANNFTFSNSLSWVD